MNNKGVLYGTDMGIYCHTGTSKAEYGKVYKILGRRGVGASKQYKIKPGWYSKSSLNPYYFLNAGDTVVCKQRFRLTNSYFIETGSELIVDKTYISGASQIILLDISHIPEVNFKRFVMDRHSFRPSKRNLSKKVDLI